MEFPSKINSFFSEAPKAIEHVANFVHLDMDFTGAWSSEGRVDAEFYEKMDDPKNAHPIYLRVRVYAGELDGEIYSEGLRRAYVFSMLLLKGMKRGGKVKAAAYNFIDGKERILAKFELQKLEGELLQFNLIEQSGPFFPKQVEVHRVPEKRLKGLGQINTELFEKILKPKE